MYDFNNFNKQCRGANKKKTATSTKTEQINLSEKSLTKDEGECITKDDKKQSSSYFYHRVYT